MIILTFIAVPFGVLPNLEYDGKSMCQSMSMARFLAKEFNLAGKTNWEQAQADMVVDCCMDLMNRGFYPWYTAEGDEAKKKAMDKFLNETGPNWLENMQKTLKDAGGEYFVGGEVDNPF